MREGVRSCSQAKKQRIIPGGMLRLAPPEGGSDKLWLVTVQGHYDKLKLTGQIRAMTRKGLSAIITLLALFALLGAQAPMRAYTLEYRDSSGIVARRWLARPIIV